MLNVSIIACLDVNAGRVVKGLRFRQHRDIGDIVELAARHDAAGADEIVYYDIGASPAGRSAEAWRVREVAAAIRAPLCVAGGIRSVAEAEALLAAGAVRVSVNSPALADPALVDRLAAAFGSAAVVVGIDSLRDADGEWHVRQYTGDPARTLALPRRTLDWVREVEDRGAGEIVLNCMGNDGVGGGYDIAQLRAVRAVCRTRLVASGGAGRMEHFLAAFRDAGVDGALGASAFHDGLVAIDALKAWLATQGVPVRPPPAPARAAS